MKVAFFCFYLVHNALFKQGQQCSINISRYRLAREQNTQTVETVSGFGESPFGGDSNPSPAKATINNDDLPF